MAWLFSTRSLLPMLRANAVWLERLFGVVLLALAFRLAWQTLA